MEDRPANDHIESNPVSRQKHSHEVLWQIMLPLVIGALVVIAVSVLSAGLAQMDASRWGSISLIWMIGLAMLAILFILVILIACIYATAKIIQVIPGAAFRLQKALWQVDIITRSTGDRIAEPFIRLNTLSTAINNLQQQVVRKRPADR